MYTKGIRKILIVDDKWYGDIDQLGEIANKTGHKAIKHNSSIYVKIGKFWELTPFTIDDFSDA